MLKNTLALTSLGLVASVKRGEIFLSDSVQQRNEAKALRREIEQSLQHLTEDVEEEEDDDSAPESYTVDPLNCLRTPHGSISKFFNLKALEGNGTTVDASNNGTVLTSTVVSEPNHNAIFDYKICQPDFTLPKEIYYSNSTGNQLEGETLTIQNFTDNLSIAYWAKNVPVYLNENNATTDEANAVTTYDYTLQKTFNRPVWNVIEYPESEVDDAKYQYKGLFVEWTAEQATLETDSECEENGPNSVKFMVYCDEDVESQEFVESNEVGCNIIYTKTDVTGCMAYDADAALAPYAKFAGAIMIAAGFGMTFYGAKFILWVIGFLIFASIQGVFFSISYSTGLVDPSQLAQAQIDGGSNKLWIAVVIGIVGVIVGGVASYYLTKLANKFAVPLIAAGTAFITVFLLTKPIIKNNIVQLVVVLIGAGLGGYFAHYVQRYVKVFGTAIIGGFLLARGFGEYIGGFPKLLDKASTEGLDTDEIDVDSGKTQETLIWVAVIIFLSVAGSFTQLKYTCVEEADDDMMTKDDM